MMSVPLPANPPAPPKPPALAVAPVGDAFIRGTAWVTAGSIAGKLLNVLGQIALAWLLSKEDFGRIGMTYTISTFAMVLATGGLGDVLVRRQRDLRRWENPALWLGAITGLAGAALMLIVAPFAAAVYDEPAVVGLVVVLAVAAPIRSVATIPEAMLRARLRFKLLAALMFANTLATMALTVAFAAAGLGAYSFVLPALVVGVLNAVAMFWLARPRLRLGDPQLRRWRLLLADGGSAVGTRMLTSFIGLGDYIVLGLLRDATTVGVYYFAFNLAAQSLRLLGNQMGAVLHPALSRIADDTARHLAGALLAMRLGAFLVIPAGMLQSLLAPAMEDLLFRDRWEQAVPIVQVLSVGLSLMGTYWVAEGTLRSQGRFRAHLLMTLATAPVMISLVTVGTLMGGAAGAAFGYSIFAAVHVTVAHVTAFRRSRALGQVARFHLVPLACGAIAYAAAWLVIRSFEAPAAVEVGVGLVIFTAIYAGTTAAAARETWVLLASRIAPLARRRGASAQATAPELSPPSPPAF